MLVLKLLLLNVKEREFMGSEIEIRSSEVALVKFLQAFCVHVLF